MEVLLNCGVLYNAVSYSARGARRPQIAYSDDGAWDVKDNFTLGSNYPNIVPFLHMPCAMCGVDPLQHSSF